MGVPPRLTISDDRGGRPKAEELHFTDGTASRSGHCHRGYRRRQCQLLVRGPGAAGCLRGSLADLYGITEALNRIYNSGYNIYTTLDPKIQEIAESVYEDRGSLNNLTSASGQLIHSGITIVEALHRQHRGHGGRYGTQVRKPAVELCNGYPAAGFLHQAADGLRPGAGCGGSLPRQPPLTTTRSAC